MNAVHKLTAPDIADLRYWRAKSGTAPDGESDRGAPFLTCSPSDGALYLHSQGRCVAGTLSAPVMCALLLNERLEPGYCRRVCDPACTIEEALRTPQERREAAQRLSAANAEQRQRQQEQDETARRRASQLDYSTLELDDLLGTL